MFDKPTPAKAAPDLFPLDTVPAILIPWFLGTTNNVYVIRIGSYKPMNISMEG